jgi:hypothetical protein
MAYGETVTALHPSGQAPRRPVRDFHPAHTDRLAVKNWFQNDLPGCGNRSGHMPAAEDQDEGACPRMLDSGLCDVGQRSRCRVEAVLVGDRGLLPEVRMTASGVVAMQPAKRRQPCFPCGGLASGALQGLAFERGVQTLRGGVVRGTAGRAHGLDHPRRLAGLGERRETYWAPWSVWKIAPARLPRVRWAAVSASMTSSVRM